MTRPVDVRLIGLGLRCEVLLDSFINSTASNVAPTYLRLYSELCTKSFNLKMKLIDLKQQATDVREINDPIKSIRDRSNENANGASLLRFCTQRLACLILSTASVWYTFKVQNCLLISFRFRMNCFRQSLVSMNASMFPAIL